MSFYDKPIKSFTKKDIDELRDTVLLYESTSSDLGDTVMMELMEDLNINQTELYVLIRP